MTRLEEHQVVIDELHELYIKKNNDYGDSFHETYEEFGILTAMTRMLDKWNRIKKLVKTSITIVKGESLRDSLVDLANYTIMTIMEMDREDAK